MSANGRSIAMPSLPTSARVGLTELPVTARVGSTRRVPAARCASGKRGYTDQTTAEAVLGRIWATPKPRSSPGVPRLPVPELRPVAPDQHAARERRLTRAKQLELPSGGRTAGKPRPPLGAHDGTRERGHPTDGRTTQRHRPTPAGPAAHAAAAGSDAGRAG